MPMPRGRVGVNDPYLPTPPNNVPRRKRIHSSPATDLFESVRHRARVRQSAAAGGTCWMMDAVRSAFDIICSRTAINPS